MAAPQDLGATSSANAGLAMGQNPNFANDLANIPFDSIISGPFTATIDAINAAAATTIQFIRTFGFTNTTSSNDFGKPLYITFKYQKPGGLGGLLSNNFKVTVPLLTMLPIPSLRLERLTISFLVNLTSTRTAQIGSTGTTTSIGLSSGETAGSNTRNTYTTDAAGKQQKTGQITENTQTTTMSVGIITNSQTADSGNKITREYSMKVNITAVQDGLPAGVERILDILTGTIQEKSSDPLGGALGKMVGGAVGGAAGGGGGAGGDAGGGVPGTM